MSDATKTPNGPIENTYEIDRLMFRVTAVASPEQYDIFDAEGIQVGYFRLRHGLAEVDCPKWNGRNVWVKVLEDTHYHCFATEEERLTQLADVAKAVNDWRKERDRILSKA